MGLLDDLLKQVDTLRGSTGQAAAARGRRFQAREVLPTLVDKSTPGGTLPGATADILGKTVRNPKKQASSDQS